MKKISFAKRIRKDFGIALLEELKKKPLESITLASLCEKASYPRSTFYNHFSDIYGLLEEEFDLIYRDMGMDGFTSIKEEERTISLFTKLYDYMSLHEEKVNAILAHNDDEGLLLTMANRYMRKRVAEMIKSCSHSAHYPISLDLVIEHYSNTVWMVSERCFRKGLKKEEALEALSYLLGGLSL